MAAEPKRLEPNENVPYGVNRDYVIVWSKEDEAEKKWDFSIQAQKKRWWIFSKDPGCYLVNHTQGSSIFVNGNEAKSGDTIQIKREDKIELGAKDIPASATEKVFYII